MGERGPLKADAATCTPCTLTRRTPKELDGAAAAEWKRLIGILDGLGHVCDLDRHLLVTHCQAWARLLEAEAIIVKEGIIGTDAKGGDRRAPAVQVWRDASAVLQSTGDRLLLSPTARMRSPSISEAEDDDAAADLFD